ncbi:RES family NAD+ phosphorylase [Thalassomonas actiniarum]|uniref:RES family NAD+ phosphorylase n=1 Tax=Thalassomonas actiniarum TaxID=485447 RepID=A0AAE9YRP8_9GAMM|nr:RES family NAD+ phosphorylase [Thalassomonas actiniarum]WDD99208.1 RES family NAD+ phosphorylase [Thalassomonas actiniarum]
MSQTGKQQARDNFDVKALTALVASLAPGKLKTAEMTVTYRVQQQFYDQQKSAALSLFCPENEQQKGRWNGRQQDFGLTYLANSPKGALAEAFSHVTPNPKGERFFDSRMLAPREMSKVVFTGPLTLIDVRALLPQLKLSAQDIEGDDVYHITQPLADALYLMFAKDVHGILYSSRWSGDLLDCAAIWSHPPVGQTEQTPLDDFEYQGMDSYEILCEQLNFAFTG